MAKLALTINHSLSPEEVLKRAKNLLADVKRDHGDKIAELTEAWDGNVGTFAFMAAGYRVSGTLAVGESTIELTGELPWQAAVFKSKIETVIRERAQVALA